MAGMTRPEGLPAAGGGRRLRAGIADVQRPTYDVLWRMRIGGNWSGDEKECPTRNPKRNGGNEIGSVGAEGLKGLFSNMGEGLSHNLGRWGGFCCRGPSFPFGWGSSLSLVGRMGQLGCLGHESWRKGNGGKG